MANKTVKSFLFKVKMDGTGAVNFDSSDARFNALKYGNVADKSPYLNDNIKIAKSTYTQVGIDENDRPIFRRNLKISADCLRHAIFEKDYDVTNGRIMRNDAILASFVSSTAALLRGYMFATDEETIKAKSPITITPAIEDSGAVITAEVGSVSGDKTETSLYYTETTGKTNYTAKGSVSLKQLEFLSCDDFFERRAIKSSWIEGEPSVLATVFNQKYGRVPYKTGIYTSAGETFTKHIGEYGLHFDEEFEKYLVAEFFKRLMGVNITRSGSYAKVTEILVKPVFNGLTNTFESTDGWVNIKTEEDINDMLSNIEFHTFFEEADNNASSTMDELYATEAKKKEERKAKKEAKKNNKKTDKTSTAFNTETDNEDASFTL